MNTVPYECSCCDRAHIALIQGPQSTLKQAILVRYDRDINVILAFREFRCSSILFAFCTKLWIK